ncbi:MAG: double-strand break repair helicase AddA [Gemmobacter sp.]|jgi:ATP-dependent helicase/nuclease subunit A|nr:double-strand break repair helicase AddA [Gemmobacter sp.]
MTRSAASERQIQAAHPGQSTWLSANAGSGKTRVLTDRVARLLLSGVEPARILCLTYTKAAASEMQNRLFQRLGEWAMKPEPELRAALRDLGIDGDVSRETLAEARRLFARAIETPGGLRIQTIHSFCASLLRRFPLEAGVSPQFTELDDRAAKLMRAEIIEEMAAGPQAHLVAGLADIHTGEDLEGLMAAIVDHSETLSRPPSGAELYKLFDLPDGLTMNGLLTRVLQGGEKALLAQTAELLLTGSTNDMRTGRKLLAIRWDGNALDVFSQLEDALLFGDSKIPGKSHTAKGAALATKETMPKLAALRDRLDALMQRVEAARPLRLALKTADHTARLHRFAEAFLPIFIKRKTLRGALDFDDLIRCAKALLTDPRVAQWVLFRLDGGIDHILVDEAQDTSPDQWRVIELLAQEFTSGAGAREVERTIFIVGDQKQSIYSFQGADVAAFARMRESFRSKLHAIHAPFQALELEYSFRSSPAILRLVDQTFPEHLHDSLGNPSHHIAYRDTMPGRIEIWPPIIAESTPEDEDWTDPVDLISDAHHTALLAQRIAERIGQIIASGTHIPQGSASRPVHAGDFLILVRRRSNLFSEIIRACKAARLPIAGADRLHLGGEVAVKDIISLLTFLSTPEDDLSLAETLRSPLCGWSEAQLYHLAQPRKGYLWEALRDQAGEHPQTVDMLRDLRDQADFLRPFELIERALTRHDGRRRLLARLGDEAEDGIDELLAQAMAYEHNDVPNLTGFLTWLQADEVAVKRQIDGTGHKIRVMTVHGAKGLEAPIVILPDTADTTLNDRDEIYSMGDTAVWRMPADESPAPLVTIRQDRQHRARAEEMRLLYVALTRAQSWIITAAAGKLASQTPSAGGDKVPAWYDLVRAGAERIGATPTPEGGLTYETGTWPPPGNPAEATQTIPIPAEIPDWATRPASPPTRPPRPVSPSDLGGTRALPGTAESETAKVRGSLLHLLLEHLPGSPATSWEQIASSLILDPLLRRELLEEARHVLESPQTRALFIGTALTEVPVTADLDGQRMFGIIDRLLIHPEEVIAIDYKSNTAIPAGPGDVPSGIRLQMRAYRTALAQIYPLRRIRTAILWTRRPNLMWLD